MFSDTQLHMIPMLHGGKGLSPDNILYIRQTEEMLLYPGLLSH